MKASENPGLALALQLIRVDKMSLNRASRETDTPRATIRAALKNYETIKRKMQFFLNVFIIWF